MPHVVVIGSHPSEFLTHLEAAGYTYTTGKTYSAACHPGIATNSNSSLQYLNTDEAPVAVAVHGSGDVGLESTQAILSLLETNAILLLFSPSLILLQVLKSAIGTVIDLPEVKLEDNVPLVVYKFIFFLTIIKFMLIFLPPGCAASTVFTSSQGLLYQIRSSNPLNLANPFPSSSR
jgi:hypothetical protein